MIRLTDKRMRTGARQLEAIFRDIQQHPDGSYAGLPYLEEILVAMSEGTPDEDAVELVVVTADEADILEAIREGNAVVMPVWVTPSRRSKE